MSDHYSEIPIAADQKPVSHKPQKKAVKKPYLKNTVFGKRFSIFILALISLFTVYCGAGFLLLPVLVTSQLPGFLFEGTGLQASIHRAAFNPLTWRLHLEKVTVVQDGDKESKTALLHLGSISIDLDPPSLLRNGLACNSLEIDKLVLSITRYKDKNYNISRFFKEERKLNPAEIIEFAELPFLFSLNNIFITNSQIIFADRLSGKTHRVEKIALTLPTLSNFSYETDTSTTSPGFSAVINGSPVELTSETPLAKSPGPPTAQTSLVCNLTKLNLSLYSHYLPVPLPVIVTKGSADIQLRFGFETDKKRGRTLTVGFQAMLKDTDMESRDQALFLVTPGAKLTGSFQPLTGNITFHNILLRNPELTVRETFSSHTLDSLLQTTGETRAHVSPASRPPSLVLELLVADDGVVHLPKGISSKVRSLHSLQASLKNFTNSEGRNFIKEKGSFWISGELEERASSFSWQGEMMETNRLRGVFNISNLPVSSFFPEEKSQPSMKSEGSTDLRGILTLWQNPQRNSPVHYTLTDGTLTIAELKLYEDKREWLHATKVKAHPFSLTDTKGEIGNIYLENGTLTLRKSNNLPRQLQYLTQKEGFFIHAIDFSGSVEIAPPSSSHSLNLANVRFQLINLDKENIREENFAFTANANDKSKLKATGKVKLSPLTATLNLGFIDMEADQIFLLYSDAVPISKGKAKLSGKGYFRLPEKEFSGILHIADATFTSTNDNKSYTWDLADLDKTVIKHSPFRVDVDTISLKNLKIQKENQPLLTWEKGICKNFTFYPETGSIACKNASIEAPSFLLHQYKDTPHAFKKIQQLLTEFVQIPEIKGATVQPKITSFHFPDITIDRGTVIYNDHRLKPPWKIKMLQLQGDIHHLSNSQPLQKTSYEFNGIIGSNPIALNGSAHLFSQPVQARSVIKTSAFPLASFGKQLPDLLDINRKGKFNLILESVWSGGRQKGMAQFHFNSVSPISDSADTSLTLALLNDKNYTFSLDIPLLNTSQNPLQPLFQTTVNHFTKLMVKASVEPLLLAEESYRDLVNTNYIEFEEGKSLPSEQGKHILARYRDLLIAHPQLQIVMTGLADPVKDIKFLQKQLEELEKKRIEEVNLQRKKEWLQHQPSKRKGPANGTFTEREIPPGELSVYAPLSPQTVHVQDRDLLELARKRAERAKEIITMGLGTEQRIRVNNISRITAPQTSPGNRVVLNLSALPFPAQDISGTNTAHSKTRQKQ